MGVMFLKYRLPSEIIMAYDDLFIGNGDNFPLMLLSRYSPLYSNNYALELFRYAFETKLDWSPVEVRDFLTMDILKALKLSSVLQFVIFPESLIPEENLFYLAWLIYPKTQNNSLINVELQLYDRFIDNNLTKLPKGFFTDGDSSIRAFNCLIYAINKLHPFNFNDNFLEYEYFSSMNCVSFLRKAKLIKVYNSMDLSPLEFFHSALSQNQKSDLFFSYFSFLCQVDSRSRQCNPSSMRK